MYDAEAYISSCLDSILNQSLDSNTYEIIVVNDGSKDRSCKIVEDYINKNSNIKLYSQENKGQSSARNFGISKAVGRYIQFVDSDDYLFLNSLHQIVKFAEKKEEVCETFDIITFGIKSGQDKDPASLANDRNGECIYIGNGYEYIGSHNYNNGPWYYWLNRDFVKFHNLRFAEGKLCEDGIFTVTALLNAQLIARVDTNVYYYVARPNSTTSTKDPIRRNKLINGFCYAIDYLGKMIEMHNGMNSSCRERIVERRDSYVFFLLVRMLKIGDYKLAINIIKDLKKKGIYPIKSFPGRDYPGMKLRIFTAIFNINPLYIVLCKLCGNK